jgi:hypothetical protein
MAEIYRTNNPLEFDDVDGIIIDETAPAPSVQGAPANTAILVGRFERGPANELIEPGSIGRLLELYGKAMTSGRKQIVNKKFGRLRIIRVVASDSSKATLTLDGKLKLDAKYPGAYGNNIKVTVEDATNDEPAPQVSQVEQWPFASPDFAVGDVDVVGEAQFIQFAGGRAFAWFNVTDGNTQTVPNAGQGVPIEVQILSTDDHETFCDKIKAAVDAYPLDRHGILSTSVIVDNPANDATFQVTYETGNINPDGNSDNVSGNAFTKVIDGQGTYGAVERVEEFNSEGLNGAAYDVDGNANYFLLANYGGADIYFWINVTDGANTQVDPAIGGTAVQVDVLSADSDSQIISKLKDAIDGEGLGIVAETQTSFGGVRLNVYYTAGALIGGSGGVGGPAGATFAVLVGGSDELPSGAGVDAGVKITIIDDSPEPVLQSEIYDNLKIGEIVDSTFANSELIDATVLDTGSGEIATQAQTPLAGGSDGTEADTDYQTAIAVAEQEQAGNVMWTDKYSAAIKGYLKQHTLNAPDKMVIVSTDNPEANLATALADVGNYRDVDGRIIYAFNGLQATIQGASQWTSAASWVASIISNTSPHIDPAYAENIEYTLGATDVKNKLNRGEFIQLKEAGIAGFEFDRDLGGFKLRSGIVTQISNSSKVTILRRRMADYLTESYARFLKNYQNAPNTLANRTEVKSQLLAFDDLQIQNGIIPSDAEVNNGLARLYDTEALNTNNSIAAGLFKILIKRRIFSSMRYIVLQAEIGESVVVTEGEA